MQVSSIKMGGEIGKEEKADGISNEGTLEY